MEKNKNHNQSYLDILEQKVLDVRAENFDLKQKIAKLEDANINLREQIAAVSEKNRKLSHYAQFFGVIGNSIEHLHSQFEKAKKRLPFDKNGLKDE